MWSSGAGRRGSGGIRRGQSERGRGGPLGHLRADGRWDLGGGAAGERRTGSQRWRPPRLPDFWRGRLGGEEERGHEQLQAQGRVIGVSVGENRRSDSMLGVAAFHGAGRQRGVRRGGW
jgi:hypothetical protein